MFLRTSRQFVLACLLALSQTAFLSGIIQRLPNALTPICAVQGYYFTSPRLGQSVTTSGVVYLDLDSTARRGFYIQHDGCDSYANSSNGLFVYLSERTDVVEVGDSVEVSGKVEEFYGRTELTTTAAQVRVIAHGRAIPAATELTPPADPNDTDSYYEHLEGMHVRLSSGRVIGPSDADGRTWLTRWDLGLGRIFDDDVQGAGEIICTDDGGLYKIDIPVAAGDRVNGLDGALDYRVGIYCLDLGAAPAVSPAPLPPLPVFSPRAGLSMATFNLSNLFDAQDDPAVDDDVISAPEYQRRLYKRAMTIHHALSEPAVLALQEVENRAVLHALVTDPDVIQAEYQPLLVDGPDGRGLDVALLYQPEQVWPMEYAAHQGCTALVDGLGPDGNGDMANPANTLTCDRNQDGVPDGNRLFSRPPLAVRLRLEEAPLPGQPRKEIWVILNHWKSKVEDTPAQLYTRPRRIEEARFVADLSDRLRRQDPGLDQFVLGDLNDSAASPALMELFGHGFHDISSHISRQSRYTYIYQGVSQTMDYILWRPAGVLGLQSATVPHVNADFPTAWADDLSHYRRSSDHDPLLARFFILDYWARLPLLTRP